jgi:hypothetical protein
VRSSASLKEGGHKLDRDAAEFLPEFRHPLRDAQASALRRAPSV